MSNLPNSTSGQQTILPDYRSNYQQGQQTSLTNGNGTSVGASTSGLSGQTNGSMIQGGQGLQPYSQLNQRAPSTVPQSIQYPQSNYYSDQNSRYQQILNSNFSSSLQQPQQQQQPQPQQQQQQMVSQPYPSYYMFNQQQPQQGSQQAPPPPPQSTNTEQSYAYGGYPYATSGASTGAPSSTAPPSNYSSLYQQSVPQYGSQVSTTQPQSHNQTSSTSYSSKNSDSSQVQDTIGTISNSNVGQYQPPGIRPRVTTTMWEDEKTLCYQVDANNVSVVRRADNNMINGTKLLNVAQMTRGRRDGILKSEKVRHVVKIGSMHLKGVWIPFERALAMAQREGFVDLLYPLFVRDIKRVIQTGVTPSGGSSTSSTKAITAPSSSNINPTPNPNPGLNMTSYFQYNQQYPQNGGASTSTTGSAQQQSPQQNNSTVENSHQSSQQTASTQASVQSSLQPQPPQPQQQVYGYQQPYYAPNQYYQAYIPNNNYSSYSTPMYSTYGYMNQQVPQQIPQSVPQQSTSNTSNLSNAAAVSTQPTSIGSNNHSNDTSNQDESNGSSLETSELSNDKKAEDH